MKYKKFAMGLLLLAGSQLAQAEQIGSVDTVFKWLGPDHKIVVEAFDDPDVQNVTCYISRAKTGGIKGGLTYGATDEFGYQAVENPVSVPDLHATILNQLGLDHERLTYRFSGRDFRLTDVSGKVLGDLLA